MEISFAQQRSEIAKELSAVQQKMNAYRMNVLLKSATKLNMTKHEEDKIEILNREINSTVKRQIVIEDLFEDLERSIDLKRGL